MKKLTLIFASLLAFAQVPPLPHLPLTMPTTLTGPSSVVDHLRALQAIIVHISAQSDAWKAQLSIATAQNALLQQQNAALQAQIRLQNAIPMELVQPIQDILDLVNGSTYSDLLKPGTQNELFLQSRPSDPSRDAAVFIADRTVGASTGALLHVEKVPQSK